MSDECLDYWIPTLGPLGIIIDCMPPSIQQKIVERLQLLGAVKASEGEMAASIYARVLSGEHIRDEEPRPQPKLELIRGGAA
jgi:hypothetical protein